MSAQEESQDTLISKERLRELLAVMGHQNEIFTPELEKIFIKISELFVDEITQAASFFASYRGKEIIEPEDYSLALKQLYGIIDLSSDSFF